MGPGDGLPGDPYGGLGDEPGGGAAPALAPHGMPPLPPTFTVPTVGITAAHAPPFLRSPSGSSHGDMFSQATIRLDQALEEEEQNDELNASQRLAATLKFERGPAGVKLLLPADPSKAAWGTCTFKTMGLDQTMSSPSAVAGSNLSGETIKWVRGDNIGRGSLGTVFQAMDQKSGQVFAIKEVAFNPNDDEDRKFKDALEKELNILQEVRHHRIVSYLGHDYFDNCLYVYLEYLAGGSLAQVLKDFGAFEEALIQSYTAELVDGLAYLHTREPPIVHRDVKGANVLVDLKCHVKLADFGCSKRTQETMSHTIKGSIPWMAPEVINNTGYGRAADVWSLGCVVIEMAQGKSPWGIFDNLFQAMAKIGMSKETPPVPENLSEGCKSFISACLQREKDDRPNTTALLEHDFVKFAPEVPDPDF